MKKHCILFLATCLLLTSCIAIAGDHQFAYAGSTHESVYQGIEQGLTEANLQGKFLGQSYTLNVFTEEKMKNLDRRHYTAILLAIQDIDSIIEISKSSPLAVFNLIADDHSLRQVCVDNLFHILPGMKMKTLAAAAARHRHPDQNIEATAWHGSFKKFGGRDLNKRYRRQYHEAMDEFAWAGWVTIKLLADMIVRNTDSRPDRLPGLLKTQMVFDGQKGSVMNFLQNGQLKQGLLLVKKESLSHETSIVDFLYPDAIGNPSDNNCPE